MGYIIDRAKERIGRVKADRATDMGIAGHQAAMKALAPRTEAKIEPNVVDRHKPTEDF
jgi:hypothetical protein